ncbi:MAG: carboxypeptidase-like regulatory domain-containing protein, partial [Cytophagales bacterium]|nr:carboxypeptidase-like regulatory domain-containing protein [Cytophagales bacterium]
MRTILLKKIWIVSRHALLITLIQCLSCVVLLAYESSAQSTDKVYLSVNWKNVNLKDALATIEEKTGYEFFFKDTNVARIKHISLVAVNESLKEILIRLSQEKGLKFKRLNNVISVIKLRNEGNDPVIEEHDYIEREISGTVTDEDGNGLPGVNVLVKNTGIGTISDADGNYKLNTPEDASVLVFSYVGYITEEVEIQGRTIINISLSPDISTLSEIIVVGYGTVQKRDLTGAVTSV